MPPYEKKADAPAPRDDNSMARRIERMAARMKAIDDPVAFTNRPIEDDKYRYTYIGDGYVDALVADLLRLGWDLAPENPHYDLAGIVLKMPLSKWRALQKKEREDYDKLMVRDMSQRKQLDSQTESVRTDQLQRGYTLGELTPEIPDAGTYVDPTKLIVTQNNQDF